MKKLILFHLLAITLFLGACNNRDDAELMEQIGISVSMTDIEPTDTPSQLGDKSGGFLSNVGFICPRYDYGFLWPEYDTRLVIPTEDEPEGYTGFHEGDTQTRFNLQPYSGIMPVLFNEDQCSEEPYIIPTEFTEHGIELAPGYKNVRITGCIRIKNKHFNQESPSYSYSLEVFKEPKTEYTDEIMGQIKVSEAGIIVYPTTLNEYIKNAQPQELKPDFYRVITPYEMVYYIEAEPTASQAALGYKVSRCMVVIHYYPTFTA